MKDFARNLEQARTHLDVTWDDAKLSSLSQGVSRRRAERRRSRAVAIASIALTVLVLFGASRWRSRSLESPTVAAVRSVVGEKSWKLADGSLAVLGVGTDLGVSSDAKPGVVALVLRAGTARFEVVPHAPGTFQVVAGDVVVEVVGTVFTVERRASRVRVSVDKGRVKVTWRSDAPFYLSAGESRELAERPVSSPTTPDSATPLARDEPNASPDPKPRASAKDWRALAQDGDFEGAYRLLGPDKASVTAESAGDLLLAADVARLSGHPSEAPPHLRKLLRVHRADPRAPLAAFTLGRVLLEELGDPRGAADAFQLVRHLAPGSPLDENALARAVEAWSRAGEVAQARGLAAEYVAKYPRGSKLRLVRHYAGLD